MRKSSRSFDPERYWWPLGSDLVLDEPSTHADWRGLQCGNQSIIDPADTRPMGRWAPALAYFLLFGAFAHPSHGEAASRSDRQTELTRTREHAREKVELHGLCDLIAQRLALIEEVAKTKWNTGSPIEDPEREQQILLNVGAKATAEGIPAQYAQHFFRLQMEASKRVEYESFAVWTAAKQGRNFRALDLKADIRPRLDSMDDALLRELKRNWSVLASHNHEHSVRPCYGAARFPAALTIALSPLIDRSAETAVDVLSSVRSLP